MDSPPTTLSAVRDRQRERLYGAVANVWFRHDGRYQFEIEALLALVDDPDQPMTVRDAHQLLVELEQTTRGGRLPDERAA